MELHSRIYTTWDAWNGKLSQGQGLFVALKIRKESVYSSVLVNVRCQVPLLPHPGCPEYSETTPQSVSSFPRTRTSVI
jgi:hypothetical protein